MYSYYNNAESLFKFCFFIFLIGSGLMFLTFALLIGFRGRRQKRNEGVHGTAHWATPDEVMKTGLSPNPGERGKGVYVGGWKNEQGSLLYLRHDGPEHIAAIAPTRSGKGVGLVLPTLLSWPHSTVIHDMKGELWAMTAGWRKQYANNVVLKFDPAAEEGSVSFNPLAEVRLETPSEVSDVQNQVTIIVDPDGKGLADHWAKTAHAFLTGVILHILYESKKRSEIATLAQLALVLSDPERPIDALYAEMLENKHHNGNTHLVIAAASRDMLNRPDQERGSVLSSAMSYLSLYRDPLVAKNTSTSDFRISDLMDYEKPVSLYLVVRPSDKDRVKPLLRLMLNQIIRVLVREEMKFKDGNPVPFHIHRLLLLLDEFPSFGRLEVFQEALAYIAGYGIKAYLIMQDIAQLWFSYGKDESIISNCHVRVAYAPNKIETAEWLSKTIGTTTIIKEDISTSGKRFSAILNQVSRALHEVSRPLLTPDECLRLKAPTKNKAGDRIEEAGDVLVFASGHAPIYGTQSLYFLDPVFLERSKIEPPSTDKIRNGITVDEDSTPIEKFDLDK
jgi:type IV secretion system protein VirD4